MSDGQDLLLKGIRVTLAEAYDGSDEASVVLHAFVGAAAELLLVLLCHLKN
jgi:hypothetical protein